MSATPLCVPALTTLIRTSVLRDRGFTIDMWTGDAVPEGLAVCADPALARRVVLAAWEDCAIDEWVRACRRTASRRPDLHIGGWQPHEQAEVHLDLVRVVPAERHVVARTIGLRHRQRAIFDLAAGALVPLGSFA